MISLLKKELIGDKTWRDWLFLLFGITLQIVGIFLAYKSGDPNIVVTAISGIAGVISVVLCAEGKISFYVFAYIQTFTYIFGVVIPCRLWGELIEQIWYATTMIYGVYKWAKLYNNTQSQDLHVKSLMFSVRDWIIWGIIFIVGCGSFYFCLLHLHEWLPMIFKYADTQPFLDSITTIAPFIGHILLLLGYREQWVFWIIEDIISVVMFCILGNWIMVAQYLFWTINCVYGWVVWSKNRRD